MKAELKTWNQAQTRSEPELEAGSRLPVGVETAVLSPALTCNIPGRDPGSTTVIQRWSVGALL